MTLGSSTVQQRADALWRLVAEEDAQRHTHHLGGYSWLSDLTKARKAMGKPMFVVPLFVFAVMLIGTGAKNVRCFSLQIQHCRIMWFNLASWLDSHLHRYWNESIVLRFFFQLCVYLVLTLLILSCMLLLVISLKVDQEDRVSCWATVVDWWAFFKSQRTVSQPGSTSSELNT